MAKTNKEWNDIVEEKEKKEVKTEKKEVKTEKKEEKTDKENNNEKKDKENKNEKTKNFPHIPCWYLVNNFQCKQANCYFNHNPVFIKTHKDKREHCVCHLYLKCKEKCNKFHNMDELMELYNTANRKLNAIDNIMKT